MKLEKLKVGDLAQALRLIHKDTGSNAFVCNAAADVLEGMEKTQDVLQSNLDNNLAELARINEMLELESNSHDFHKSNSNSWVAVCEALAKAVPDWNHGEETPRYDYAVYAIEQLAAKAERLEQHCTYRSKTWGAVCRALDKACPGWAKKSLNTEDATAAAVEAIERLVQLSPTIEGFDLGSQTDFIGRAVIANLGDISASSGGGGQATISGEGFSGSYVSFVRPSKAFNLNKKLGPVITFFPMGHEAFKAYPVSVVQIFRDSIWSVLDAKFPNSSESIVIMLENKKSLVKREFEARLNQTFTNAKDLHYFDALCNEFEWV